MDIVNIILLRYFNPRSPCGERLYRIQPTIHSRFISIHAPRAGSDTSHPGIRPHRTHFNPRSPCGERRSISTIIYKTTYYFNPRSPCGERLSFCAARKPSSYFNPRSPCGERREPPVKELATRDFNPRSPCGERPFTQLNEYVILSISIHAPRAGSDPALDKVVAVDAYFNPRSPCGERLTLPRPDSSAAVFQSTLPVRGATLICQLCHDHHP